jgi:hypothetical protein
MLTRGRAGCHDREPPRNGDGPKSPLLSDAVGRDLSKFGVAPQYSRSRSHLGVGKLHYWLDSKLSRIFFGFIPLHRLQP